MKHIILFSLFIFLTSLMYAQSRVMIEELRYDQDASTSQLIPRIMSRFANDTDNPLIRKPNTMLTSIIEDNGVERPFYLNYTQEGISPLIIIQDNKSLPSQYSSGDNEREIRYYRNNTDLDSLVNIYTNASGISHRTYARFYTYSENEKQTIFLEYDESGAVTSNRKDIEYTIASDSIHIYSYRDDNLTQFQQARIVQNNDSLYTFTKVVQSPPPGFDPVGYEAFTTESKMVWYFPQNDLVYYFKARTPQMAIAGQDWAQIATITITNTPNLITETRRVNFLGNLISHTEEVKYLNSSTAQTDSMKVFTTVPSNMNVYTSRFERHYNNIRPMVDSVHVQKFTPDGSLEEQVAYVRKFAEAYPTSIPGVGLPSSIQLHEFEISMVMALQQNYPNPFNPSTIISFEVPQSGHVRLVVFDILGRHVATLADELMQAGEHQIRFNASHLPSGVYIYRLEAGNFTLSRTMTLLR